MKVLFDHPSPFLLAHGGFQTQIEQTKSALQGAGVHVEYLRWWDATQTGDLIHFFGRPGGPYIDFAHSRGMKVVVSELLTELGSRSPSLRVLQKALMRLAAAALPKSFLSRLGWDAYQLADACIALTGWEAALMTRMFRAPPERVHVVPNGVEDVFFDSPRTERSKWLICTATITERKRVLETAQAAILGRVPISIVGKPYSETSGYVQQFKALAEQHGEFVQYTGGLADRAQLARAYRAARGFVLLSSMESLSLSALEAAACECPLLLSDLPWARTSFGAGAQYCPVSATVKQTAGVLERFHNQIDAAPRPPRPGRWSDIGVQLRKLYESLVAGKRGGQTV
jgi:glycosyltransferase involved in cell wall biosynthesis